MLMTFRVEKDIFFLWPRYERNCGHNQAVKWLLPYSKQHVLLFFSSSHHTSDSLTVCCHKIFIAFEYPRKIRLMMLSWNLKRPKFSSHFVEEQGQKLHLLFDTYIKTFTRVSLVCEIVFNFIQFPSSPFSLEKITWYCFLGNSVQGFPLGCRSLTHSLAFFNSIVAAFARSRHKNSWETTLRRLRIVVSKLSKEARKKR